MDYLFATMVAALLVSGMGLAILGSIKTALAGRLQMDEARVGGLVSLFGFAIIPAMLVIGFFTDAVDKQIILSIGLVVITLSLALLGWAKTYRLALAGVLLFSTGWSLVVNPANVLAPSAFGGSEVYAQNLANVFFGLGAFLTPLGVALLLGRLSFPVTLTLVGAVALVPVALAMRATFPLSAAGATLGLAELLANPFVWLCGFALFFYGPMEASLAAWSTTYLRDQGVKESTAAYVLSSFWLMYMAARLVAAFTVPKGAETMLILALGLASIGILTLMVLSRGPGLAIALVAIAGFVFGPIFGTLVAVLLGHVEKPGWGRAVGLLFAIGGVGWSTIPILIGNYAQRTSLQRALWIVVAAAGGLSAVALALLLMA
jgi:fucose permease